MRTATEGVREASDKTEKELTAARDLIEERKMELQKATDDNKELLQERQDVEEKKLQM